MNRYNLGIMKPNGIILALALWLAFCGMASAEQLYVNESGWWRDGGVFNAGGTPIQAAVDAADSGDSIYVDSGNYYENVDVDKWLTLEGAGADVVTVAAAWAHDHVFEVIADYVNLSGFKVTGATGYSYSGIYLSSANHCNISGNNVSGNRCGIYLVYSSKSTLWNNIMSVNMYNFGVYGDSLSHYTQNIDPSNMVDGKPIYYWVDRKNKQIPSDAGFVGVVNSTNIMVSDLTLTKNREGVLFAYTEDSRIENVTVNSNHLGIYLYSSNSNILMNNTANSNWYGIYLHDSSTRNTLESNTANSNKCNGIWLSYSCNSNMLMNNTANSNNDSGIILCFSDNNVLKNNTANSNNGGISLSSDNNTLTNSTASSNNVGINLRGLCNSTITKNTANSNHWCGIWLDYSSNNIITCNLIQNNTRHGFFLYPGVTNNNISYNNIIENGALQGDGSYYWQFRNEQFNLVEAKCNYWGYGMNNSTIDASIYDDDEEGKGKVEFYPFETDPAPCTPTPDEPPAFTTTDAMIALEIAVGSREYDPYWDVSGDDRVTSLDALMILQAAAEAISL